MEVALVDGRCHAITGDSSWMANVRASFHAQVSRFVVLPQTVTIDPMSPAYRTGNAHWASLVDWTVWPLLQAKAYGVTQTNVAQPREDDDLMVRRLTGATPWIGKALGVSDDAFVHAIQAVGNYAELYNRDIVRRLGLPRAGTHWPSKLA